METSRLAKNIEESLLSVGLNHVNLYYKKQLILHTFITENGLDVIVVTGAWLRDNNQIAIGNICTPGLQVS